MMAHNIQGAGDARGCTYCGDTLTILNQHREDGRLPACPDAPQGKESTRLQCLGW